MFVNWLVNVWYAGGTYSDNAPLDCRDGHRARMEIATFGYMSVVPMTCEPVWKWSKYIKPIAGTLVVGDEPCVLLDIQDASRNV